MQRWAIRELLTQYTRLANEYANLTRVLRQAFNKTYGKLTIRDADYMTTSTWVTCTSSPLVRHHIGCTPGVRLHLSEWFSEEGVLTLGFDKAWVVGLGNPIEVNYYTEVSSLVGITALYQAGLGWASNQVINGQYARLLQYISRSLRSESKPYSPVGGGPPGLGGLVIPRGVGVVGGTIVVGVRDSIYIRTGRGYEVMGYDELASGEDRGFGGYIIPFIESMYDTLAQAYTTTLALGRLLGLL